jgi:uncharacterized membrane protein YqgA involved in biofilm formation
MRGLGTIINTLLVAVGGLVGMRFRTGIPEKVQKTLMQACGVSSMFIGAGGTLAKMLHVSEDGSLAAQGTLLLILSLVLGAFAGELMDLEAKMDDLGEWLKARVGAQGDNSFVEGFVNVSLIVCVGAMAIVGAIQDGISGDFSMLAAKSVLDMIIAMIFASTYGLGAVFAALAILVYQGSITLLAMYFGSFASEASINVLTFVGSALIFCVGVNISFGKKFRVGNLLPALAAAVVLDLALRSSGIDLMAL